MDFISSDARRSMTKGQQNEDHRRGVCAMKTLTTISLFLSIIAVALAFWAVTAVEARAEAAVREREQWMLDRLKPTVHAIYSDFDLSLPASAEHPQTLEDLFEPMLHLMRSVASDD